MNLNESGKQKFCPIGFYEIPRYFVSYLTESIEITHTLNKFTEKKTSRRIAGRMQNRMCVMRNCMAPGVQNCA